ncbi:myosin-15-like [Montipora capricornis]|uniref:myosin-15-like n=1 Tax=Montipora capricornis TaxID=246305 RepID=UPI0035F157E3
MLNSLQYLIKVWNENFPRGILRLKLEVQRLAYRPEYKDRELANLRCNMKEKEQTFIELLDELDHANMNNEDLTAHLEKKEHDYSYLREELELLQGCLKLSEGRERMLELRVESLEDNCTTSRNDNFKITAEVSNRELIETKTTSELQALVHATTESKHREAVRRLENEMENLQLKLTENNDLLTNMEAQFMLKQSLFEEELQNAKTLFNQKNFSLQETETKLQVLTLTFANTEKKHQDTIEQLQGERERLQMLLTDQSNTLEQKERELQLLTSSLACAKQSHEHGMKQKQIDLESIQRCLNEKTHTLEETQKNLMAVSATVDEIQKEAVVKLQEELNSTQSASGDNDD